jgi:ubiquinone/menaquinone biosynthesis C-methylase UbiE
MTDRKQLRAFFRYDENHPFATMYPLLARQFVEDYGITSGRCLDIGTGGGPLLIELGKITNLELVGLDIDPEALALAADNARRHGLDETRSQWRQGDVQALPLPDDFADVVVSRGSIPFWDDYCRAFREIHRVLRPGGLALIGGGFSRYQSREEVARMRPSWARKNNPDKQARWLHRENLEQALRQAGVPCFDIDEDYFGIWAVIRKTPETGSSAAAD